MVLIAIIVITGFLVVKCRRNCRKRQRTGTYSRLMLDQCTSNCANKRIYVMDLWNALGSKVNARYVVSVNLLDFTSDNPAWFLCFNNQTQGIRFHQDFQTLIIGLKTSILRRLYWTHGMVRGIPLGFAFTFDFTFYILGSRNHLQVPVQVQPRSEENPAMHDYEYVHYPCLVEGGRAPPATPIGE